MQNTFFSWRHRREAARRGSPCCTASLPYSVHVLRLRPLTLQCGIACCASPSVAVAPHAATTCPNWNGTMETQPPEIQPSAACSTDSLGCSTAWSCRRAPWQYRPPVKDIDRPHVFEANQQKCEEPHRGQEPYTSQSTTPDTNRLEALKRSSALHIFSLIAFGELVSVLV